MPGRRQSAGFTLLTLAVMLHIENGDSASRSPDRVSRCGMVSSATGTPNYVIHSRIVGGHQTGKGQHSWTVSLKRYGKHFCGATIVSDTHVITAAHCVSGSMADLLKYIKVHVGDHDFSAPESAEQIFPVKAINKHPNFNPNRPINYDIAILVLDGHITFDERIQPVCLPNPDDVFEPGYVCVALGWGRMREAEKALPSRLQEVSLPIIEPNKCASVMGTLKGSLKLETVICAGFPDGGKDACQGDSGGPFVCQRSYGSWVLAGVISWGMGCARKWDKNFLIVPDKRGSPGIFTDVQKLYRWIFTNLNTADTTRSILPQAKCSVKDGLLPGSDGKIILPKKPQNYYRNNELCEWILKFPRGMAILLNFSHFDVESDFSCNFDYLAIYSEEGQLIGKFCGDVLPRPIFVSYNTIKLKFFSDFHQNRTGFALKYSAVDPHSYEDSGCGSLAVHFEEGEIQSMNYPENYDSFANCHWIIHAPTYCTIQLTFEDFEIEASTNCSYDNVRVYQDAGAEIEIGKFCGFSLPPSISSTGNFMHLTFTSDATENYRGFRVSISFVISSAFINGPFWKDSNQPYDSKEEMERFDAVCGVSPMPPRFLYSKLVGGEEAMRNSWPWHVSVQNAGKHTCDGAIIFNNWILTSAGCAYLSKELNDSSLVVAGLHKLSDSEHDQKRSVKQIFVHTEPTRNSTGYDIALLQLTEPLQFNRFILPICLPKKESEPKPSTLCIITGWGLQGNGADGPDGLTVMHNPLYTAGETKASKLQQLEVPILLEDACKDYYADHQGGITDRVFCAGFPTGEGNYSCTDRSGAPLVCLSDNSRIFSIFGIANFGVYCKNNSKPGIYTKVPLLIDWIWDKVNGSAKEMEKKIVQQPNQFFSRNEGEQRLPQGNDDVLYQESPCSNESRSSMNVYFASGCEDVVLLESGEIKLDIKGQTYPNGFSCQWRIIAPKDQIIKLDLKELQMPTDSQRCCNTLVVYEGASSDKVKAQLTGDMVPCTVWSEGSSLTIVMSASAGDLTLEFWMLYSFHDLK